MIAALVPAALVFLAARLFPIWRRRFQGCDAFNILMNARALRRRRRLPIRMPPLFLLEEQEQWYPPGFLILCALFPEAWLERNYWLVNHVVDFGSAALIGGLTVALGGGPVWAAAALLAYALAPPLVNEFSALNARPLGLLLLNAFLVAAQAGMADAGWMAGAVALGVAILYSHKLSAQQLWFTMPVLALATGDWRWLGLLAGMYAVAFALWPHGFARIVAGHAAIVRFWHRNWPLLGAHMVRQSPVYGDGRTRTQMFRDDTLKALPGVLKEVGHQNYFVLPLALAAPVADPWGRFLLVWAGTVYVWGFAIHLVPALRGIGLGRQYFKFALVPSLVYVALAAGGGSAPVLAAAALAGALTVRHYLLVARLRRVQSGGQVGVRSPELDAVLEELRRDEDAVVLCLPVHLSDLVAYATGRPVYWGTHSHVFDDRLERFFPVLRRPLSDYAADGGLTRLLLDTAFATPAELGLEPADQLAARGRYILYRMHPAGGQGRASPDPRGQPVKGQDGQQP